MFRRFAPLCAKSLARRPHPAATLHPRIARANQADKADEGQYLLARVAIRRLWNDRFGCGCPHPSRSERHYTHSCGSSSRAETNASVCVSV
jgi:hypothetical protein